MTRKYRYIFASNKKVHFNKIRFSIFIVILVFIVVGAVLTVTKCTDSKKEDNEISILAQQRTQGIKMMIAARQYVYSGITYDDSYFGGYPPDDRGVCTDVIWKGFKSIDVNLKDLVDSDIDKHLDAYSEVISTPDPGIDFRVVPVLEVFFQRHGQSLSTNVRNILAWQPGDIVIFESSHIAMVSSIRNIFGEPYIIQHGKDPAAEEDRINASDGMEISSHFRWTTVQ